MEKKPKAEPIAEKVEAPIQMKVEAPAIKEEFDIDTFQIKTLADFAIYNKHARKLNRPVKVPDESYHKKVKVKFQRFDQPENVLKAWVRNKDIDWKGQLKPGCTYELAIPVVQYLNRLAVPIFGEVKVDNGGEVRSETKQIGERNRFSCQLLDVVPY